MSAVDLTQAVGFEFPTLAVAWTTRDLLIYAIGIGATPQDLRFIYEQDPNFVAFPTFPVVLSFKGDNPEVVNFHDAQKGTSVPGLPDFDPSRIVHGGQSVEILKPIPIASGKGWTLKRRIVGVRENKSGVIVDNEHVLVSPTGVPYTRMLSTTFNVGGKVTGKPLSKTLVPSAVLSKPIPEGKAPDHVLTHTISLYQGVIYRLSGDYNGLHVVPSIGIRAGFGGVIVHGLGSSYGFASRGIIAAVAGGDPAALKLINARFKNPDRPGDILELSIWEMGPGPNGTLEVAFVVKNLSSGKVSLGPGVAHVVAELVKSKL